jgi:nucleoside-diphosphate-sugar epimerase
MSVFGGNQYRPLLHVRDVATAAVPQIEGNNTGIYNLHSENITIIQLAERIQKLLPDTEIEKSEVSFQDARNYRVNCDKAKNILGFSPKWTIDDGIREIAEVIGSRRIKDVSNHRFNNSESLKFQFSKGQI